MTFQATMWTSSTTRQHRWPGFLAVLTENMQDAVTGSPLAGMKAFASSESVPVQALSLQIFLCGKSPKAAPFNAHSLSLNRIIVGVLCPMLCCLISVILVQ